MRHVMDHPAEGRAKGAAARAHVAKKFSRRAVASRLVSRLSEIEPHLLERRRLRRERAKRIADEAELRRAAARAEHDRADSTYADSPRGAGRWRDDDISVYGDPYDDDIIYEEDEYDHYDYGLPRAYADRMRRGLPPPPPRARAAAHPQIPPVPLPTSWRLPAAPRARTRSPLGEFLGEFLELAEPSLRCAAGHPRCCSAALAADARDHDLAYILLSAPSGEGLLRRALLNEIAIEIAISAPISASSAGWPAKVGTRRLADGSKGAQRVRAGHWLVSARNASRASHVLVCTSTGGVFCGGDEGCSPAGFGVLEWLRLRVFAAPRSARGDG